MVTLTRAQRLNLPLAPTVAVAGGLLIALLFLTIPAELLERLIVASGIPAVLAAAEPPLGVTARIALGLVMGGGFTAFAWFGLTLLDGDTPLTLGKVAASLRRRDVHPDGPPRPPLFAARDLGTPFLDVKAPIEPERELDLAAFEPVARPIEQPLPRDLDQPMAAFDPVALRDEPLPAPEPVAPLAPPAPRPALIDPGDRIEIFELTPVERPTPPSLRVPPAGFDPAPRAEPVAVKPVVPAFPERVIAPETEATVHDLLSRLERGIAGKVTVAAPAAPAPVRAGSLAETLSDLRRMATAARSAA